MNISDLAEEYLIDRKDGMRKLTASFLNEVMQRELKIKSRPDLRRHRQEKRASKWNKTTTFQDHSLRNSAG